MMKKLLCTLLLTVFAFGFAQAQTVIISGNGQTIPGDGSNTPTATSTDDTYFGTIDVTTGSETHTFTVTNNSASVLTIGLDNLSNNTDFSQTTPPSPSAIGPGATSQFDVTFDPTSLGVKASVVTVTVFNNDTFEEEDFTFNVGGEGANIPPPTEPVMKVYGGAALDVEILDGNPASVVQGSDFEDVELGGGLTRTFRIRNEGTADLVLTNAASPGSVDFVFSLESLSPTSPPITITPGDFLDFTVTYTPDAIGSDSATIFIAHNDTDIAPFNFGVLGNGIPAPPDEPEIVVLDGATNIASGGSVDFGSTDISTGSISKTFTIRNDGIQDLVLSGSSPFVGITGANASDFSITSAPTTPIVPGGTTTFTVVYNPSAIGTSNAVLTINNNDTDEGTFTINVTGQGIDASIGNPLLITQYYEGGGNEQWIEIKNISTTVNVPAGLFLCLYEDLHTLTSYISTNAPDESSSLPAIPAGGVILIKNPSATNLGNLGATPTTSDACTFDGNDVILVSTTNDATAYDSRIEMIGVVGTVTPPVWGANKSLIKGCGTTEAPSTVSGVSDYIELTLDEVNTAGSNTNLALGTQTVGPTTWSSSWSNGIPDKTKNTIVSGSYTAANGSFESCDLTVTGSGNINLNGGTTNFVKVGGNFSNSGSVTIGDTESLVIVDEAASVSGSISKIETTTTLNSFRDVTYWSAPVVNPSLSGVFTGVDPNRIFQWNEPSLQWNIASGSMNPGKGYIAEAPSTTPRGGSQTVTFSGTPNNGVVTEPVTIQGAAGDQYRGFNLVGNPYPCAIDMVTFIQRPENSAVFDGTIYIWTHSTEISNGGTGGNDTGEYTASDYISFNLAGPNNGFTSRFMASSQGFMVRATSNNNIFFNHSMKVDDQNTQFFKGKSKKQEKKDRIWLNLTSKTGGALSQILVGFFNEATDSFDRGYDGLKNDAGTPVNLYSIMDGDKYVIQGLGTFNSDKKVALGFDSRIKETLLVSINKLEGALENEDVYLVDNKLNITHDLKSGDYEFEVDETGNFADRFTLQFNNAVLSDGDDLATNKDYLLVTNNEEGGLTVKSNVTIKNLRVYDILGRVVAQAKADANEVVVNPDVKSEVLIVKATLENGAEVSKKVIKH